MRTSAINQRRKSARRRFLDYFRPLRIELLESRWAPAVLTVNSLADGAVNFADATVTLRDAIEAANTDAAVSPGGPIGSGADEIRFQAGLSGQIALNQGQLGLRSNLTITGPGADLLSLKGTATSRVFEVTDFTATVVTVTISGLTITGGNVTSDLGGGIDNSENLTVLNCAIRGNSADVGGGGIFSGGGVLTVRNCTISGNQATGNSSGGGINSVSTLIVQNSTISGNFAGGIGGGIAQTSGMMTLQNSTITQNHSDNDNSGTGFGGGVGTSNNNSTTLHNTIVADNFKGSGATTEDDINIFASSPVTGTNNLIGTGGSGGLANGNGGNQVGVTDPKLGPLTNNGGPTLTHALSPGSPALDAGNTDQVPNFSNFDQRGDPFTRIVNTTVDIGAVEARPITLVVDINLDEVNANQGPGDLSLREAINLANGNAGADTITFAPAMAGQTILLTLNDFNDLTISDPLTIQGRTNPITINGRQVSRLFDITATSGNVTFDRLILTGGKTIAIAQKGGAIRSVSSGQLTIQNSILSGNSTVGNSSQGGAVSATGLVVVTDSTISGNSTAGRFSGGGGIFTNGSLTLTGSTVSGNSTSGYSSVGGGISTSGAVTIANSTISSNSTTGDFADGGGVFTFTSALVANSTISGNSVAGTSAGTATDGGGVYAYNGPVTIRNSIVAGNLDKQDGSHPDLRQANNGPATLQFSLIGGDPRLAPLANNGGPTQTHALCTAAATPHPTCAAASPALNAGSNALLPADTSDLDGDNDVIELIPFDQRGLGFVRVFNAIVDIGALESQPTFPWHNFAKPFDVSGGLNNAPDNHIVAADALAVINYLNAFGAGPVPANADFGQPFGFVDTSGGPNGAGDNFITAGDALDVINFINAGLGGEGEGLESSGFGVQSLGVETGESGRGSGGMDELIALLAMDPAVQTARRKRG